MAIGKTRIFFLFTVMGLTFYLFKWTRSVVYAWESCGYKCASVNVDQRICYNNVICKCLETGKRVTDALNNTSGEYYYVKITECSGKCVEDFNKYSEPVCLDERGEIENIEKIENEIIEDVKKNPSATINTGNLGSSDGMVPPQPPGTTTSLVISTNSNEEFWCEKGKTIDTAIGCLPITVNGLVEKLLPTIFGIAGGIAFLMMVYGFILMATSSGDEKKVQAAKQIVTSAITGLLVAIFALFLYKLIAIDILKIPGI